MLGKVVAHYEVLEKLGEGGMGVVYKARDLRLDRTVALKFLPPDLTRDPDARERFVHEARAASALDHQNICVVHDIGETGDGQSFIVMGCYEGESLKTRIDRGPLTIPDTIEIALQVAQGLARAHEHGIVHRDIKPANVMITKDGVVKIVDFGLAKLSGQTALTRSGTTMGTAAYMSPEQARGDAADHRTDLWALGVMVYEMLSGRNPFAAEFADAVTYRILNEDPEYITRIRPDVPKDLEALLERMLAKDPARRTLTADKVCSALRGIAEHPSERGRQSLGLHRLGKHQRKTVIRILPVAVVLLGTITYLLTRPAPAAGPVTIALLPLVNITGTEAEEWFTDGMTEALITSLARINSLRVTQRASAMRYRGTTKSASEIGSELGVSYILEGSVARSAGRVRITVRLIDALTNRYLWAEEYARNFTEVLTLQGDVSRAIASQVRVTLTREEQQVLGQVKSVSPEAYEAYLKGNFFLYKLTREGIGMALQYYERAVSIDSTYAPAFAGIALAWGARSQMGYLPVNATAKEGRWAEARALTLDSSLAEVHYMIGARRTWMEWNWESGLQLMRRSIALKPNLAEARAYLSHLLFILKRPEEAMEQVEEALRLDPLNPLIRSLYGMDLMYARRYDDVIQLLRKTLENSPREPIALSTIRSAYHQKKMYAEALEAWRLSYEAKGDPEAVQALERGHSEGGYAGALRKLAEMLIERTKTSYVPPWQIATLYVRAGMREEAFAWFEKAYDAHDPNMPYLSVDPIFDDLRDDPRFRSLLGRMGLPY